MASSGSAVGYPRYPESMRRTAPAAQSRIPVSQTQRPDANRHVSAPHRSRLLAMQDTYQKKLLKEKEEKMLAIYNKHQDQAMQKVTRHASKANADGGQGIVRDFFKERKQLEQSKQSAGIMSRDTHFQKKLQERKSDLSSTYDASAIQNRQAQKIAHLQEQKRDEERKQQEMLNYKAQWQQNQRQQQPKPAKGTSRSKPLAPIQRNLAKTKPHGPPSPSYDLYETSGDPADEDEDDYSMKPLSKPQKVSHRSSKQRIDHDSPADFTPEPAKPMNRKKIAPPISKVKEKPPIRAKKDKKSDFLKWQEEQDLQRQERLNNYEKKNSQPKSDYTVDYDREIEDEMESAKNRRKKEYDDMMAKERELEAMIAKHKDDLAKMSVDNDSDDDEMDSFPVQKSRQPVRKHTKPLSKPTAHYKDTSPFPYHDDEDDYESRAGEFKSRQRQEPKPKPKRKAPSRDPDPIPPSPPPPAPAPVSYDTTFYDQAMDDDGEAVDLNLAECPICGRRFAAERLSKHKTICKKASQKKRKVFDTTKHRTEGTELAQYVRKGKHLKKEPPVKPSNWKRKHEEFVRSIRDARQTQAYVAKGGKLSDLPPPPPSENPDYKQCPYCARRFNPTAAERHIPHCKNTKSRPKPPPRRK